MSVNQVLRNHVWLLLPFTEAWRTCWHCPGGKRPEWAQSQCPFLLMGGTLVLDSFVGWPPAERINWAKVFSFSALPTIQTLTSHISHSCLPVCPSLPCSQHRDRPKAQAELCLDHGSKQEQSLTPYVINTIFRGALWGWFYCEACIQKKIFALEWVGNHYATL